MIRSISNGLLCASLCLLLPAPPAHAQSGAPAVVTDPIFSWSTHYTRCTSFAAGNCTSFSGPVDTRFTMGLVKSNFPSFDSKDGVDGQRDNVLMWGYNYDLEGARINKAEPAFKQQIESSFWDGRQQLVEYNWDFMNAAGAQWRPLYYIIRTAPAGGDTPAFDTSLMQIKMCEGCANFELSPGGNVNIGIFEPEQRTSRLDVNNTILNAGPGAGENRYGIASKLDFNLRSTGDTGVFAGGLSRATWSGQRAQADTLGEIVGQQGLAEISGESVVARSVTNYTAGLEGRAWFTGLGVGGGSSDLIGVLAQSSAHGPGPYKVNGYGLYVASPARKGMSVTYDNGAGIFVQDMKGYGEQIQGSIVIDKQTGGGGSKGNIALLGGDFDSGHLAAGSGHLWYDDTHDHWRAKEGPPASATDGGALVTGSGSAEYGPLLWSLKPTTACTTICEKEGLSCQDAYPLSGGAAVGCANKTVAKSCLCK
jgi:hypothetical protein